MIAGFKARARTTQGSTLMVTWRI